MEENIKNLFAEERSIEFDMEIVKRDYAHKRKLALEVLNKPGISESDKLFVQLQMEAYEKDEIAILKRYQSRINDLEHEIVNLKAQASLAGTTDENVRSTLIGEIETRNMYGGVAKAKDAKETLEAELAAASAYMNVCNHEKNVGIVFGEKVDKEYLESLIEDYQLNYIEPRGKKYAEASKLYDQLYAEMQAVNSKVLPKDAIL